MKIETKYNIGDKVQYSYLYVRGDNGKDIVEVTIGIINDITYNVGNIDGDRTKFACNTIYGIKGNCWANAIQEERPYYECFNYIIRKIED